MGLKWDEDDIAVVGPCRVEIYGGIAGKTAVEVTLDVPNDYTDFETIWVYKSYTSVANAKRAAPARVKQLVRQLRSLAKRSESYAQAIEKEL